MPDIYWRTSGLEPQTIDWDSDNWTYNPTDVAGTPGVRPQPSDSVFFDREPSFNDAAAPIRRIVLTADVEVALIVCTTAWNLDALANVNLTVGTINHTASTTSVLVERERLVDGGNIHVIYNGADGNFGRAHLRGLTINNPCNLNNGPIEFRVNEELTVNADVTFAEPVSVGLGVANSQININADMAGTRLSISSACPIVGNGNFNTEVRFEQGSDVDVSAFDGAFNASVVWRTDSVTLGTKTTLATWANRILFLSGADYTFPDGFECFWFFINGGSVATAGELHTGQFEHRLGTFTQPANSWVNVGFNRGGGILNQIRRVSNARIRRAIGYTGLFRTQFESPGQVARMDNDTGNFAFLGGGDAVFSEALNVSNTEIGRNGAAGIRLLAGSDSTWDNVSFPAAGTDVNLSVTTNLTVTNTVFQNVDASAGAPIDARDRTNTSDADDVDSAGLSPTNPNVLFGVLVNSLMPIFRN